MVAGRSGIHETPWIPALSHTGDSTCLSSRIKAQGLRAHRPFGHSYLYNTPARNRPQLYPQRLARSQSGLLQSLSNCPHRLPIIFRLLIFPTNSPLCSPVIHNHFCYTEVHYTHPRNLFHDYVSDHSSKSRHPALKVTNQSVGNKQAKGTTLPQKHLATFRQMPCYKSQPWLIWGQVIWPTL